MSVKKLATNGGPINANAVLKKAVQVAGEQDGPLVTLPAGIPARELTERQLAQLHPDHFEEG